MERENRILLKFTVVYILISSIIILLGIHNFIVYHKFILVFICFIMVVILRPRKLYINQLLGYKIMRYTFILFMLFLILNALANYLIVLNYVSIAITIMIYSNLIKSIIPLIMISFITHYRENLLNLLEAIPSLYIFMYYITMIFVIDTDIYYIINSQIVNPPSLINSFIFKAFYFIVGIQILSKTVHFNKYEGYDRNINNLRKNILFNFGILVYFIVIPLIKIIISNNPENYFELIKTMEFMSLFIVFISFKIDNQQYISMIKQPLMKLVIINKAGLPLVNLKFDKNQEKIEESFLYSGSIKLIVMQLQGVNNYTNIKSIDTDKFKLLFKVEAQTLYILQTYFSTKIIENAFKIFKKNFALFYQSRSDENLSITQNYSNFKPVKEMISNIFAYEF